MENHASFTMLARPLMRPKETTPHGKGNIGNRVGRRLGGLSSCYIDHAVGLQEGDVKEGVVIDIIQII